MDPSLSNLTDRYKLARLLLEEMTFRPERPTDSL